MNSMIGIGRETDSQKINIDEIKIPMDEINEMNTKALLNDIKNE